MSEEIGRQERISGLSTKLREIISTALPAASTDSQNPLGLTCDAALREC